MEEPRSAEQRIADTHAHLEGDADLWIATAGDGRPWLVPLSFHWTGEVVLMVTLRASRTYRNLAAGSAARLALGHTRDVVMIDAAVDLPEQLAEDEATAVASVSGLDPRTDADAAYLRCRPQRMQAWRTSAEIEGRTIMRDGTWSTLHAG